LIDRIKAARNSEVEKIERVSNIINMKIVDFKKELISRVKALEAVNPENVLRRGYAILRGEVSLGNVVKITTFEKEIRAEVKEISER
jgi:exonuclease VII large subunit